ncbi:cation diffusion facilitator family transporter [Thermodesulfobacteriota bacterium]
MEQSEKIGTYSIAINILLVAIKGFLSFLSGSVALMADAVHSFTDVISSATVLVGIKISKRKSKNFPYGLYKVENFVSILSSLLIFLAGCKIIHTVFIQPHRLRVEYLPYAVAGMVLTIGITFAFSRYELRQGKEIGSPSLIADAEHIKTDMLSSMVILVALISGFFGLAIDKIAALVVVFLVFKASIGIFTDALRVLLDASIDFATMDQVKSIILKDPRVAEVIELRGRNSGRFKFIEADILIKGKNLDKAYSVTRKIEEEIRKCVLHVDHILIHYRPQKKDTNTIAIPLQGDKQSISEHFGEASYFYFLTIRERDGAILSEEYCRNPFAEEEKGKGIKVSEWLLKKAVDSVYSPKGFKGKGPGYVFSDAGVTVIPANGKSLEEIQRNFQKEALKTEASI